MVTFREKRLAVAVAIVALASIANAFSASSLGTTKNVRLTAFTSMRIRSRGTTAAPLRTALFMVSSPSRQSLSGTTSWTALSATPPFVPQKPGNLSFTVRRTADHLSSLSAATATSHTITNGDFHTASSMTSITDTSPDALATSKRREKSAWLKERLRLSDATMLTLVQRYPQITGYHVENNLQPTLEYLEEKLLLSSSQLSSKLIQRVPQILGLSLENNLRPTLEWLQTTLELSDQQLSKLVATFPSVLGYSINDKLRPTLDYLTERLDLDDKQLCKLVWNRPAILGYSIQDNLEVTISWLETTLALNTTAQLQKIILASPTLFGLNVEHNLQISVNYLHERLDISKVELSRLIQKRPPVLGLGIDSSIAPTLDWLVEQFELKSKQELASMVQRLPSIFGLSIPNNLQPTLEFYVDCLGGNRTEAINLIRNEPFLFSYSLDRRLRPRLEQVRECYQTEMGCDGGLVLNSAEMLRVARMPPLRWNTTIAQNRFFAKRAKGKQ